MQTDEIEQVEESTTSNLKQEQLVEAGLHFLKAMNQCYGTRASMDLWEQFGSVLSDDLKNRIFYALLQQDLDYKLTIKQGLCMQSVAVIKPIREYTGLGLKEAKEIWDRYYDRGVEFRVKSLSDKVSLTNKLSDLGMRVR